MRYLGLRIHEVGCFRDVDVDLSALPSIVAVSGPNGAGKCVPRGTPVYVHGKGTTPIEKVVPGDEVLGLVRGRTVPVGVTELHELGAKPIVRLLARGWPLLAATTHPVLTARGWVPAGQVRPGDHLAFARRLETGVEAGRWTDDEVRLGGYFIADGVLGDKPTLCAQLEWKQVEFARCIGSVFPGARVTIGHGRIGLRRGVPQEAFNLRVAAGIAERGHSIWEYLGQNTPRFLRGQGLLDPSTMERMKADVGDLEADTGYLEGASILKVWTDAHGLHGLAAEKSLGAFVHVPDRQVGILLAALWFADGYVSPTAGEVSYSTASATLAQQVRDLLLRVGVLSARHSKFVDGKEYFNVVLVACSRAQFAARVPLGGPKGDRLRAAKLVQKDGATNADSIPFALWSALDLPRAKVAQWRRAKSGMSRTKLRELGAPTALTDADIWWAPVERVDLIGEQECFDLTVDSEEHAYVADGVHVHNSSLLEQLTSGSLFRECPTRGALADLARARDSFVEVVVENGARYTIRQGVDAVSRKGETLILDADGTPVVASGKVADGKAWVAAHFPAREVLYASTVAIQGGAGNFLGLTAGERKAVILRALGIEDIERRAEQAREQYRVAKAEHATILARIADERARGGDVDTARTHLSEAEREAREAEGAVDAAREELARAAAELESVRARNADVEAARARVAELEQRVTAILKEHADVEERLANNQRVIEDAAEIRAAAERVPTLRAEMQRVERARADLERDIETGEERARGAEQDADRRRAEADENARKARAWEARATAMPERREAAGRLPERRAQVEALTQAMAAARQAVDDQQAWMLTAADDRIGVLRCGLETIAAGKGGAGHAAAVLGQDDAAIARVHEGPARLAELQREHAAIAARLASAEQAMRRDADLAAPLAEMEQAVLEAGTFAASATNLRAAADESARRAEKIRGGLATDRAKLIELDAELRALQAEALRLEARAKLLSKLEAAEARIAELRPMANSLAAQARILRDEARAVEPPPGTGVIDEDPFTRAHDTARHDLPKAEERARAASAAVARAQTLLEAAEGTAARLSALEATRVQVAEQVADWSLLADSLGRDGLQAHLVDAAGPELTALANDLLHRAFGPRFTVSITTTRPKADGKGEREVFDVSVLDVERGRDGDVAGLSGGERVIVGEAISLALAMMVARRHGLERPTLVRDESGAALDPANGRRWISMLRRAVELVGADRLLFVTHSQELAEMADARLVVADGTVRVEG